MSSDFITFVATDAASDAMRQVTPTEVSSARVIGSDGRYQMIATLHGHPGTWKMSSPGGLVDTLSRADLFNRFIEVVLCHLREARRFAA